MKTWASCAAELSVAENFKLCKLRTRNLRNSAGARQIILQNTQGYLGAQHEYSMNLRLQAFKGS